MVHPLPPSILARLFGRRQRRRRAQEPADLGTALGLELTLDQQERPEPPAPAASPRSWLLLGRRVSTTG